jgi:Domain of unknown function (DUF4349)
MAHVNTTHHPIHRPCATMAAALTVLALGASACGSDRKSLSQPAASIAVESPQAIGGDAAQVASAQTAAPAATAAAAAAPAAAAGTAVAPARLPTDTIPENKYLAIDVTYGVVVDDINKGIDAVVALAKDHGGRIDERNIKLSNNGDRSDTASFTIKLPPSETESAIADLKNVGKPSNAAQGNEDLTTQAVDLDARLLTAQASLDRVRKLLESTTNLGEVISLESELTNRETTVEQLLAQKRAIGDRVALATLRVQLSMTPVEATTTTSTTVAPIQPAAKPTVGKAFKSGWKGFVNVLVAIMIFLGYTAPFLVVVAIGAAVLIPITRRRRVALRNRSVAPPHPPAPVANPQTTERDSVGAARNP